MAHLYGKKAKAPQNMPGDGRAVMIDDSIALAANPTAADVINFRLPAGFRVGELNIRCDDIDTNGAPTFVFGVGYRAADSGSALAANATYFSPVGQTTAQASGTLRCSFKPITFQEDVYVTLTVGTASATFAAGEIHMIAVGAADGPK